MAQTKPISVPVLPGMREDVSTHLAPVGTLRVARNVRFPVSGEAHARRGTRALPVATSADLTYQQALEGSGSSGPDYLAPCPGGFVFGVAGYGYRYDFGAGRVFADGSYSNAIPRGRLTTIASEEAQASTGTPVPWPLSQAVGGGYVAIVWSGGSGAGDVGPVASGAEVKLQVFTASGTLVLSYSTNEYSTAWVVYDSTIGGFVLIAQNGTAVSGAVVTLAASGPALGSFVSLVTLASTTSYWAACSWQGTGWALTYHNGINLRVRVLSGTTINATQTFAVTGADPMSIFCTEEHLFLGWVEVGATDNTAFARVMDTSLTVVSGVPPVTLYTSTIGAPTLALTPPLFTASLSHEGALAVIGRSTDLTGDYESETWMVLVELFITGGISVSTTYPHAWPVTSPFNGGMIWCRLRTPNTGDYGNNYVRHALLDFMTERFPDDVDTVTRLSDPVVALLGDPFTDLSAGDYAGGAYRHHLCPPIEIDGQWIAGIPRLVRAEYEATFALGFAIGEWLRFETEAPRAARPVGADVVVPGSPVLVGNNLAATIQQFYAETPATGRQAHGTDLGFLIQPPGLEVAESVGGDLTLTGQYQYRAVVEWIDPEGRRWRSKPSRIYGMTLTGSNDRLTHTGADIQAFMRQLVHRYPTPSCVVVHLYRTLANGAQFYRCTPPQGAPLANSGSGISYVDDLPDDDLGLRELLYTDGGVLDNEHAPSCQFISASEDRAWAAGLWDAKRARSSKLLVPGEPIQFTESPAFDVVLPVECTGIASQDGNVILFGKQSVFAVLGTGPTDQGQGAWDSPRVVTRSTGCVNGRSLLESSAGVFFQSRRGIELLPRGLGEPQFVGSAVQETFFNTDGEVLSAAVITSDEGRTARFCIGGPDVLVFDLDTGAWSLDRYPHNVTAICDTEQGAVIAFEQPTAGGYGFLLEEIGLAVDAEDDVPVAVASELEWAAIHPFTIAGWGRFNCAVGMFDELQPLGYQTGDCSLFVSIDNHTDVGATFDMQALAAPDYRKHTPAQMNGTAVRLKLTTEAGGWRFLGWTLDLDDHGGSRRVAESEAA